MAVVNILNVAQLCGLDIACETIGHIEVQAHCPFCGDHGRHLYINVLKNIFHCQRCKVSGDAVGLYAMIHNTCKEASFKILNENENVYVSSSWEPVRQIKQYPLKPLEERSAIYTDFLSLLNLSFPHRRNLRLRGLPDNVINRNMYKSVPLNFNVHDSIISKLLLKHELSGVPGFYFDEPNGKWMMTARAGFFIPVRSPEKLIQGLQIRLDDTSDKKYRWFSSSKRENGCTAKPWIHTTGNAVKCNAKSINVLCITEGALKADIASYLSDGTLFDAVSGINALNDLEIILSRQNPDTIFDCTDMDKFKNPYVAMGHHHIREIAQKHCRNYVPLIWNRQFNGIDDFLLYRKQRQASASTGPVDTNDTQSKVYYAA